MADETQRPEEQGPLPRSSEAVDWWLKKWGRQAVVDGQERLTGEDVERLIEANGGTGADLYLRERNMQGAHLEGANLRSADLQGVNFEGANIPGVDLTYANLQGANLFEAKLQGAELGEANIQGADLTLANLQQANLFGADLSGADLRGVELQGAILTGASISPDTNLEGVEWDPKYISILERRGNYVAATLVYRRLKEWYRGAGMLTIAREFLYREQEASRKAHGQRLGGRFKERLATAWRRLMEGNDPLFPKSP